MSDKTNPIAVRALEVVPPALNSSLPEPFASRIAGREKRRLGEVFGLGNFGVNLVRLAPGGLSSIRHCHSAQDEFVYILEGAPTLITDAGATALAPGMCAGFKAGSGDAHQLRNDTAGVVWYLEVGDRAGGDEVVYPDDDLALQQTGGRLVFTRKNGEPYPKP
jgi:uncharacterized cupin superfamily protein